MMMMMMMMMLMLIVKVNRNEYIWRIKELTKPFVHAEMLRRRED